MAEEWRLYRGGPYAVSNMGGVRNGSRIKKPSVSGNGYLIFGHYAGGKRTNVLVHRAVAEVFIGPCPDGMEVNHIDGDKLNPRVSNLEYVTRSGNGRHATAMGLNAIPMERAHGDRHWTRRYPDKVKRGDENGARLHPDRILRGDDCPASKLTAQDVGVIRRWAAEGMPAQVLADKFGVTRQNIKMITSRKSWRHVE